MDEIFSDAGVAEDDELRDRAQRVVDMLPEYIDQEDIEGFVSFIREETSAYGNERALVKAVLDLLLAEGEVTEEFVANVTTFLDKEAAGPADEEEDEEYEDDEEEEDEEEEMEISGMDLGAEPEPA